MKSVWGVLAAICVAASVSACATTTNESEEARSRFLPPMPSIPALPTIKISEVRIPGTGREAPRPDPSLEPVIYWRVIEDDILIVHADTNGCTARSDFVVNVVQYHEDIYTVSLVRDMDDRCTEDMPWGIQLGFGFEELGVPPGGQIVLLNPVDNRPWDWYEERTQVAARR